MLPIRIVIKLEGGLVQWVGTDISDEPVHVAIIDYDTDGASPEEIVSISQDGAYIGTTVDAVARIEIASIDPSFVDSTFAAIENS